jgi:hypothetical protein
VHNALLQALADAAPEAADALLAYATGNSATRKWSWI